MMLLDGLVALCVTCLVRQVNPANAIHLLMLASDIDQSRLQEYCLQYIVVNIESALGTPVVYGTTDGRTVVERAPRLDDLEQWMAEEKDGADELLQELITLHCKDNWEEMFARYKDGLGLTSVQVLRQCLPEMLQFSNQQFAMQ